MGQSIEEYTVRLYHVGVAVSVDVRPDTGDDPLDGQALGQGRLAERIEARVAHDAGIGIPGAEGVYLGIRAGLGGGALGCCQCICNEREPAVDRLGVADVQACPVEVIVDQDLQRPRTTGQRQHQNKRYQTNQFSTHNSPP